MKNIIMSLLENRETISRKEINKALNNISIWEISVLINSLIVENKIKRVSHGKYCRTEQNISSTYSRRTIKEYVEEIKKVAITNKETTRREIVAKINCMPSMASRILHQMEKSGAVEFRGRGFSRRFIFNLDKLKSFDISRLEYIDKFHERKRFEELEKSKKRIKELEEEVNRLKDLKDNNRYTIPQIPVYLL